MHYHAHISKVDSNVILLFFFRLQLLVDIAVAQQDLEYLLVVSMDIVLSYLGKLRASPSVAMAQNFVIIALFLGMLNSHMYCLNLVC